MKLLKDWESFLNKTKELSNDKNRGFLYISTFNITKDEKTRSDILCMRPNKLIIGISESLCRYGCEDCATNNFLKNQNAIRFKEAADFDVKITENLHLKCIITERGLITGGINLTNSGWSDAAIFIDDLKIIQEFKTHFEMIWSKHQEKKQSKPSNNRYIFTGGKYKGFTFDEIKKANWGYIEFCLENMGWFKNDLALFGIDIDKEEAAYGTR